MKARRVTSFEQLMDTRYGDSAPSPRRFTGSFEELLESHYGAPSPKAQADALPVRATTQSLETDDGTLLLVQDRRRTRATSASMSLNGGEGPELRDATPAVVSDEERARQERLLDLCAQPPAPTTAEPTPTQQPTQAPISPANGQATAPPSTGSAAPTDPSATPATQPTATAPAASAAAPPASSAPASAAKSAQASEDEFLADMKAIMSGQKSYDPLSKSLIDRHGITSPPEARDDPPPPPPSQPPPRIPPAGAADDIFQRIAQSMEYAGAYDLGAVELDNRFAQFDEAADKRRPKRAAETSPSVPEPPAPPTITAPPAPTNPSKLDEFNADLRDMLARPSAPRPPASPDQFFPDTGVRAAPVEPPVPMLAHESTDYVEPLYASGEHVRAGEGLYPHALVIGQKPGVAFSYGEIIAMGDLFDTVDTMMAASVDELSNIKGLLNADVAHYAPGGRSNPAPGSSEWEWVTSHRKLGKTYLGLAEDNYEHFAPNLLFPTAKFIRAAERQRHHKKAWEDHHLRALGEVAKLKPGLDPGLKYNTWPLIINAFGDHFLTDAFSSGHLLNRAEIMDLFTTNFYSGGKLTKAAETFIGTVAKLAFKGRVAQKFEVLETREPYILWWHPNIDGVGAFTSLLIKVANQAPERMQILAIKALHDKLNKEGIEVTNGLGATPWQLTGDGNLTETTLKVMQAAVKQSVANIVDPAARQPGFDPKPFLARVWAYVPQLTQQSLNYLHAQVPNFISPNSVWLAGATAELIHDEVDTLITELLKPERHALRPA